MGLGKHFYGEIKRQTQVSYVLVATIAETSTHPEETSNSLKSCNFFPWQMIL